MSDPSPNPYEATPATPLKPSGRMEYMRSFHFIFENPNWMTNVLWCAVCLLSTSVIPVIGQLIVIGYLFEVIEAMHTRRTQTYPDFEFDFDRLIDYLVRGFWVFLVQLILSLILIPIILGLFFLMMVLVGLAGAGGGEEGAGIALAVVLPIAVIVFLAVTIIVNLFMVPFVLRAGLTQDFGQAFNLSFTKQFVSLTWKEMIVAGLFGFVAVLAAEAVGLALLCIGVFFTLPLVFFMYAHLGLQLYELHLARGGEAIPLKPAKPQKPTGTP